MAYNAATAAANKAASTASGIQEFALEFKEALLEAVRGAIQPPLPPKSEIVTVERGHPSKLERQVFCPDCLGRDGGAWGAHKVFWLAPDPQRPGEVKRMEVLHAHPRIPKTISYDAISVREGLESGDIGKQCLQCGQSMGVTV